jgi:MFS transporter, DHA2 family, multidrug resistance protein
MARLAAIKNALSAHGQDPAAAQQGALRIMSMAVSRQSLVLTFEKLFMLSGLAFLCVLPLLYFFRAPRLGGAPTEGVHVEL